MGKFISFLVIVCAPLTLNAGGGHSKGVRYAVVAEEPKAILKPKLDIVAPASLIKLVAHVHYVERRCLNQEELTFVAELLIQGATVDERDANRGSTALMFAAQRGDLPLVVLLLKHGANPLATNAASGKNAFTFAGSNANVLWALTRYLKEPGNPVDSPDFE